MVRVVVKFWLNEVHCVHTELTIQYCLNDGWVTHDYIYILKMPVQCSDTL